MIDLHIHILYCMNIKKVRYESLLPDFAIFFYAYKVFIHIWFFFDDMSFLSF